MPLLNCYFPCSKACSHSAADAIIHARVCLCGYLQPSRSLKQSRSTWWRAFASRTWSKCLAEAPNQPWMDSASASMRTRSLLFLGITGLGRPPPCKSPSLRPSLHSSISHTVTDFVVPLLLILFFVFFSLGPSWLVFSRPLQGQPPSMAKTSAATWTAFACLWECALNTTFSFGSMRFCSILSFKRRLLQSSASFYSPVTPVSPCRVLNTWQN